MSYSVFPIGGLGSQLFDDQGKPLAGGEIWTYAAGTSTPEDTWSDNEGISKRSNPIILDSAGRVPDSEMVYLVREKLYSFIIRREITTITTIDDVGYNVTPTPPPTPGVPLNVTQALGAYSTLMPPYRVPFAAAVKPAQSAAVFAVVPFVPPVPNQAGAVLNCTAYDRMTMDILSPILYDTPSGQPILGTWSMQRSDTPDMANPVNVLSGQTTSRRATRVALTRGYYTITMDSIASGSFSPSQVNPSFRIVGVQAR